MDMLNSLLKTLPAPVRRLVKDSVMGLGNIAHLMPHGAKLNFDLRRTLPKESIRVVFDVGANVGQSIADFREEWPQATIHSFEPDPDTFARLKGFEGPTTRLHNIGLGREIAEMRWDNRSPLSVIHRVAPNQADSSLPVVQLSTLDAFCEEARIQSIDFLKIDTEGHDLAVLQGGAMMLSRSQVGVVMTEVSMNSDNQYHVAFADIHQQMSAFDYHLFGLYEQTPELDYSGNAHLHRANVVYISREVSRRNGRKR